MRGQEKGKLKDISNLMIYEDDVDYLIKIKDRFHCYKLRYDDVDDPYPVSKIFITILNYFLVSLILSMKIVIVMNMIAIVRN